MTVMNSYSPEAVNQWIRLCAIEDVPKRGARRVTFGEMSIAVVRTGSGAVLAIENKCPHRGGNLSEGIVTDHSVICPLHNWKINMLTGEACAPDKGCVKRFPISLRDGDVYMNLSCESGGEIPLADVAGVHPDNKRPKLGRRRAQQSDFRLYDFSGELPALGVDHPSPATTEDFVLKITGRKGGEVELSFEDLATRYPVEEVPAHLTCLMFGFSHPVAWRGVRLADVFKDVLAKLGEEEFPFASFYSWDTNDTHEGERFFETLPAAYALDPRTMLAFGMDGQPMLKKHGGPLRLVVPFLQGYKSVKWLSWIKLTDEDEVGYKKKHGFIEFPELASPKGWTPSWVNTQKDGNATS